VTHDRTHQEDAPARNHRADAQHRAHLERLATALEDLTAAEALDLATADRATMALALERMRGGLADVIRMEKEHHPEHP
jgi:hypothetical protein